MLASAACSSDDVASGPELDLGPTFGAEISVTIRGRGRVTSTPAGIDCPSTCFGRIAPPAADPEAGADAGAPETFLLAAPTGGARFVGWSLEEGERGLRARGPAACSPMTRKSATPAIAAAEQVISLPFADVVGTPPKGHEAECVDFTTVPVAYVLTATFADDFFFDAGPGSDGGAEAVFEAPAGAQGSVAREIGVTQGAVYWRFERNGSSGVASGYPGGDKGTPANVLFFGEVQTFDVDTHVAFQLSNGDIRTIAGGSQQVTQLASGVPPCVAMASDSANVYCRSNRGNDSVLYAWSLANAGAGGAGGGAEIPATLFVHVLPPGKDLAVDSERFYFSDDQGGIAQQAIVESAPLAGNGGAPPRTLLTLGQTSPRSLVVGPSHLFWIDEQGSGFSSATFGPKDTTTPGPSTIGGAQDRFVAADPTSDVYWVGTTFGVVPSLSARFTFRTGLAGLGGIAADASYVYWTQSDGRVYRALKD
jgi:hypothetical protein